MGNFINCVLLVDDDKATNFVNERVVTRYANVDKVTTVQSGKDALKYLNAVENSIETKPDVIFLDINMPAMNGWEFLVEFSKLNPSLIKDIKVILLSTSSNPEDIERSQMNGKVMDFLHKPLSPHALNTVLNKHFVSTYTNL